MKPSAKAWVRALEMTAALERDTTRTFPSLLDEWAERFGDAPALIAEDSTLSYASLACAANRYSRWALAEGMKHGDVVCLFMTNHPQYIAIWLGLSRVGVIVALLNTNLTGALLAHSVNVVAPRAVIVGSSVAAAAETARQFLPRGLRFWYFGDDDAESGHFNDALLHIPGDRLTPGEFSAAALEDRALYIYTSGTTGPPKAAIVTHLRLMQWTHWFAGMMDTQPEDRMYNCLPMYHSIGGVVATGAPMVAGGAVVLRERFSAREFWRDIRKERCTLFQYIGELCRYLIASDASTEETQHQLRLCCGNGLRRNVWVEFQRRFQIPQILEYYASTEGSFSLYNCEGQPGAIGRIPSFLRHRLRVALVQLDPDSELPVRDSAGRCLRCVPGESGEAIGEIVSSSGLSSGRFEGYADASASAKKVLRDVFAPGDAWYRTGDLMRQDQEGYFYFVDRIGDTFRWKGENVSTSEVASAIVLCSGIRDVTVYGVAVPETEGRAGMAALLVDSAFSLARFGSEVHARLPPYSRPLFLRIVTAMEMTGTFRHRKQELAKDGFDPLRITDSLYFHDSTQGTYVPLTPVLYRRILDGRVRT